MARGEGDRPVLKWAVTPSRVTEGGADKVRARVRYLRSEDIVDQTIVWSIGGARELAAQTDGNGFAGLDEALQPAEISGDLRIEAIVRSGHGNTITIEQVIAKPTTITTPPEGRPARVTLSLVSTTPPTPPTTATTFKVAVQVVDQDGKGVKADVMCRGANAIGGPTDDVGYGEFDIQTEKETQISFSVKGCEVVTNSLTLAPAQPKSPKPGKPESLKEFAKGIFSMLFGTGNSQGGQP